MIMRIILLFACVWASLLGQENVVENFYASGKINVVIAVVFLIFAGIVAQLIRLEIKLKQIERQNQEKP
jgi:Na+/phosphate symporter